jgi:hypothetical protein
MLLNHSGKVWKIKLLLKTNSMNIKTVTLYASLIALGYLLTLLVLTFIL